MKCNKCLGEARKSTSIYCKFWCDICKDEVPEKSEFKTGGILNPGSIVTSISLKGFQAGSIPKMTGLEGLLTNTIADIVEVDINDRIYYKVINIDGSADIFKKEFFNGVHPDELKKMLGLA